MKIPVFILSACVGVAILLEGWTLTEIINLKLAVAEIKTQLHLETKIAKYEK